MHPVATGRPAPQELKHLHLALERQKLSLDVLHRRQAELSEAQAAPAATAANSLGPRLHDSMHGPQPRTKHLTRQGLESIGVLCGQAFLSRLHRRRFQRVLSQHPLSRSSVGLEALMQTPELAVNIAAFAGPGIVQATLQAGHALCHGVALCHSELDRLFPCSIYLIGGAGASNGKPLRSVERFRPDLGESSRCAAMRVPRAVGLSQLLFASKGGRRPSRGGVEV
eukprot:g3828.t1